MIFSPITIDGLTIKNRFVMAPMCMYKSDNDGKVTPFHIVHYASRAMGGIGLIIVEATGIEECGKISDNCLGIYSDEHVQGLSQIVKEVHSNGAKIGIQLAHAGRKCTASVPITYSPTALPYDQTYKIPKEATQEDILRILQSYKLAAIRAKQAGFDIVEIHAAHGYLLSSFLSPLTNKRTDEYGGNIKNRANMLDKVIEVVKEGFEGPVSIRVNASDIEEGGVTPESIAETLNIVKSKGICLVHVSSGGLVPVFANTFPGHQVPYAQTIKNLTSLPVIAGGQLTSPQHMQDIISNNRADMVFIGRELMRNPFFPLKAANELDEDIPWPYTNKAMASVGRY